MASGRERVLLRLKRDYATTVDFSPDGRRVIVPVLDGTVRLLDAAASGPTQTLRGHEGPVWAARFSPDGTMRSARATIGPPASGTSPRARPPSSRIRRS